jgi:hypothetical protein
MGSADSTDWFQRGLEELEAQLGGEFPNLTLVDYRNQVVMLDEFRGKRIAILVAAGPCPNSIKWLRSLGEHHWQPPPGYDELIVLVSGFGRRDFNKLVRESPSYLIGWPLIEYLAYVRWYPIMYGVDKDGRFEEYWDSPDEIDG